ncbi:TDT family transporter [Actinomycetospora straminea]|uniref:TDT family transporter n=1 Tax=Actinomycetospora straminea TaxID=663607 RepID=A0ABP9EK30_9PSEU|nr:TDT family transporter [Actinomycetospora straminea]MDD7933307.1 TDT family transporter [Actinomycetospora straminea]
MTRQDRRPYRPATGATNLDAMLQATVPHPGALAPSRDERPAPNPRPARRRLLRELEHPRDVVAHLGPNWFSTVMGTGIVGGAAASLPVRFPGLTAFATVVWGLAALLLVALVAAWGVHWVRHTETARGHAADPVMAQSYGAVAMAVMTVGAGAVLLGPPVLGTTTAVAVSGTLWAIGTVLGLATAVGVPYLMIIRHEVRDDAVSGAWLMPVVPPMVSAADGALLIPHLAAGTARTTMLLACTAMVGAAVLATLALLPQIWRRLVVHGTGPAAAVPTTWIVLGPLGQSITAVNLLGTQAAGALPEPYATGAAVLGLLYGVPVWGFAVIWLALAAAVTLRTARRGLPFSLTWWSFTFPVGTLVTGTSALAARVPLPALDVAAIALYLLLVAAWALVAVRTVHGGLVRGHLFAGPTAAPTVHLR